MLALCSVLLTLLMVVHAQIPNRLGNLGSLVETFLPWVALFIPVLLILGLVRRSATAVIALLLPAVVWLNVFGGLLTDKSGGGGDLTVATHNVNAGNPDPDGTAQQVAGSGADVVALQELPGRQVSTYEKSLADRYPYHSVQGTVGLWSKYPLADTKPVDIKMGWTRAMRSTVRTPQGEVAVYVAHLPSVRVKLHAGFTANQRDNSADALGEAIADERVERVVLLGDLNGTMNDRSLNAVTAQMRSTQGAAGDGFGFKLARLVPDGPDRPDHGQGRRADGLLDPRGDRQRPPPDRGPRGAVTCPAGRGGPGGAGATSRSPAGRRPGTNICENLFR